MTSVQGLNRLRQECLSVAFFVAPPSFSSPSESEIFKQPNRSPRPKSLTAATNIPKYSEDDLQGIFKAVLEAQAAISTPAPAPAPAPAPTAFEESRNKSLKACFSDIYYGKFHIDCFNVSQQCKDYFATTRATGTNKIFFAAVFFRD